VRVLCNGSRYGISPFIFLRPAFIPHREDSRIPRSTTRCAVDLLMSSPAQKETSAAFSAAWAIQLRSFGMKDELREHAVCVLKG
jgi:hypothetical protein